MARTLPVLSLVTTALVGLAGTVVPAFAAPAEPGRSSDAATAPLPFTTDGPASASSNAMAGFGFAVAMDGDRLLVGSPDEFPFFPMPPASLGLVHVFEQGADGWEEVSAVSWSEATIGDGFGKALAISGDWLAVGAPGASEGRGAVAVFTRDGDGWAEAGTLRLADGAAGDALGQALAWSDGMLWVGAPGAGEGAGSVVGFGVDDWTERARVAPDETIAGSRFGSVLDARDDMLLVTAPGAGLEAFQGGGGFQPGVGYLFSGAMDGWQQIATLPMGGAVPAGLGLSGVLLDGEVLLGAPIASATTGSVVRFVADETGAWTSAGPISVEAFPSPQALLGLSMARAGDDVLVGAPFANTVIVLSRGEDGWSESQRLTYEGSGQDFYGMAIAGAGDRAVVGAPGASIFAGIGEVLERGPEGWTRSGPVTERMRTRDLIAAEEPLTCAEGSVAGFGCEAVDLAAFVPLSSLGAERGVMVNDVWGWTDPETGHEWALVGRTDGMAFVDITDPAAPFYAGELPLSETGVSNIWRDTKVYADHAYIVADGAGNHGMQIFDLTRLREVTAEEAPVTFEQDGVYTEIASAHNIVINEDSGFGYAVGSAMGGTTCGGGLHMIDLRDPGNPTFAGCFQDGNTGSAGTGYSHDAQCIAYHGPDEDWAGREICFGANENALSIADVTDKENPVAIAAARYPNSAYLHQGWVSEDHRWFFMNDELDELSGIAPRTRTLVWDIEDLDDPVLVTEHLGTTSASDHNLYVAGDLMYQSNYVSGLRVLDVSDPANPVEVAWFDTVPTGEDAPGFAGSWSNYPFFESGTVIVTSMREGLFLLKVRPRRTVF
ncbi:MAG: choice-of-anchor B family protein [Gemmatimonadetes bacterium]|nr:choice-of-anchor B family protein [Gemmatimonadota bacterium]